MTIQIASSAGSTTLTGFMCLLFCVNQYLQSSMYKRKYSCSLQQQLSFQCCVTVPATFKPCFCYMLCYKVLVTHNCANQLQGCVGGEVGAENIRCLGWCFAVVVLFWICKMIKINDQNKKVQSIQVSITKFQNNFG